MSNKFWATVFILSACLSLIKLAIAPTNQETVAFYMPALFMLAAIYQILTAIYDELRKDKK